MASIPYHRQTMQSADIEAVKNVQCIQGPSAGVIAKPMIHGTSQVQHQNPDLDDVQATLCQSGNPANDIKQEPGIGLGADQQLSSSNSHQLSDSFILSKEIRPRYDIFERFCDGKPVTILHPSPRLYHICGCFSTRKQCIAIISSIVLSCLVLVGVALFFLIPRIPSVLISDPFISNATDVVQYTVSGSLDNATIANPFTIQVNLFMNISVVSENYYPVPINDMFFTGQMIGANDATVIPNCYLNGRAGGISFPPRSNYTFTMPIELIFTVTSFANQSSSVDQAILMLKTRCGRRRSNLFVNYEAVIDLPALSWTGYKPKANGLKK
ncbi:hypothetical protein BCR33DRAFT_858057 [Rhizoclosmatium globosum]|uniref:Uncharacterized protein n=1 Tax=Rhizoclosmatium globosum TaxID=329046 RepID=A0A1Y2B0M7_9FUNG|nr:hypothetical protein BCR33DRAFT_858057 [Rhizoclosmatium globosum]|eukprot:ORY28371.1 hypothetical protein BCR33DRAFT_858057 [Rhizoclosmatium globosum]